MGYTVFSDGASRGNPGLAGAGFVIYDSDDNIIFERAIPLGVVTNNIAEYTAVIEAAKEVSKLAPDKVVFYLDSELIVRQVLGKYKVKDEKLKPLFLHLQKILSQLEYDIIHIPREKNKVADKLSNKGVDLNSQSRI